MSRSLKKKKEIFAACTKSEKKVNFPIRKKYCEGHTKTGSCLTLSWGMLYEDLPSTLTKQSTMVLLSVKLFSFIIYQEKVGKNQN